MKKWLLKIAATLTAIIATLSMAGCVSVYNASSAYEIAVKNGFVGTEEEWLESLKCDNHEDGLSAYEIAVKNGFKGTEEEWLQSLKGLDGNDGENIDINKMYEEAKKDGFQGSMSDFLKEYFDVEVAPNNDTETIAHNMMSTVSIICVYDVMDGETVVKTSSAGSGIIYHLEKEAGRAYIVTNYHVIHEKSALQKDGLSEDIYVYLHGAKRAFDSEKCTDETGSPMKARVVGGSPQNDVAVLAVEDEEYLKTSAAEEVKIREESNPVTFGEKVYVIGNGGGRGISVSDGIVSAESETITLEGIIDPTTVEQHRVIRTDAVVNKGNSGGGLYDTDGKLVGLVNAKGNTAIMDNVGYAIPIDKVCRIADEVIATGKVDKGFFGATFLMESSVATIDENGRLIVKERIVVSIEATDPQASSYGILKNGDVIKSITIKGKKLEITRLYQVGEWLILAGEGDTATVEIERNGEPMTQEITFAAGHILTI